MKLKDKVALITGSAQGIGKAIASAMAKEGAKVIVSDVNLELAKQTAKEFGPDTLAIKINVADQADVEAGIKQVVEKFGQIPTCKRPRL